MTDFSYQRSQLVAAIFCWAIVALVFAVIWIPWFAYNHVPEPRHSAGMIEKARIAPDDALLNELSGYDLYPPLPWANDRQLINAAEKLLSGRVELPGFQPRTYSLPQNAETMASGPTMWQLFVHGLGLPRILLDAYKANGNAKFLQAVAEYLIAYDAYEGSGWAPSGYLWNDNWKMFVRNDHAVATRVPVLTEFWRLYRKNPNYRSEVGEAVLRMVARAAHLLAEPSRFTVATNHGVMQNLAYCNIELSFPTLPGSEGRCNFAFKRLGEQLAFFISDEGFMLEHSPGYQGFSLRLIGIAFRYMTLSKLEVPRPWVEKYLAAQRVYANLRRPDGSLPVFGDTDGGPDGKGPAITAVDDQGRAGRPVEQDWSPKDALLLAPVAGYSLWWDGLDAWPEARRMSQTAVAWSYFHGMGHKHADEMSLAVWARGRSWWGNVGYWPYDAAGRKQVESWDGGNAPHLVDEPADSSRETRLRYHGREGSLAMIDLERHGPGIYTVRRQVVQVGQRLWMVIDSSSGAKGARTRTIWSTAPTIRLTENAAAGGYKLTDSKSGLSLQAFFDGAPGFARRTIEGSYSPFAGWLVVEGRPRPAPAVIVEQPADGSWALASWSLADKRGFKSVLPGGARMQRWAGPEDWEVVMPATNGSVRLRRLEGRIDANFGDAGRRTLVLAAGPDISRPKAELSAALAASVEKYRTADMSGVYRLKVTVALLAVLLFNAIVLRAVRHYRPAWTSLLRLMLSGGWLLLGYYFIFLRSQLL